MGGEKHIDQNLEMKWLESRVSLRSTRPTKTENMHLRQKTIIDRPPMEVWRCVINPQNYLKWNEKIASLEAKDRFQLNQRFVTHYQWGRKQLQCMSAAIKIEEARLLELKHSSFVGSGVNPAMEVIERVTLEERGRRTVVAKNVFVKNHNIPWFFVFAIWLINRIGKPVKEDSLKVLCETTSNSANRSV